MVYHLEYMDFFETSCILSGCNHFPLTQCYIQILSLNDSFAFLYLKIYDNLVLKKKPTKLRKVDLSANNTKELYTCIYCIQKVAHGFGLNKLI